MSLDPRGHESPAERRTRIFVRQRARRRTTTIIIALLFLAAGGAIYGGYRFMTRTPATVTAEVPLIHADDQPTRKKPAEPGGMTVPDQDSLVLNRTEPKSERLLPPPEAPLPRPAPAPPAAEAPPAPTAAEGTPPAPPAPPAPPPSPPQIAKTEPPATPPPKTTPAPAPPPPAAEHKPKVAALPPPAAAPPGAKGYRLQLGSVRSAEAAAHEWAKLRQQNPDLLGRLGMSPVRVDLGDRGIYYRIQAGPVADAATAERACDALKRRGVGCLLVKP